MSETKFHTHSEPQAKLVSYILIFLSFSEAGENTEGSGLDCNRYYHNSIPS
jgi:hypothetical protein